MAEIPGSFNSKMVRLRGLLIWALKLRIKFQFQNGAIESQPNIARVPGVPLFQFQNGAIESRWDEVGWFDNITFQFQNGAIESAPVISLSIPSLVSIPKWCD